MPKEKGFAPLIIIFAGVLLVAAVLGFILFKSPKSPDLTSINTSTTISSQTDGWVYVGDFPYSAVDISTLKLKDGSYIASGLTH